MTTRSSSRPRKATAAAAALVLLAACRTEPPPPTPPHGVRLARFTVTSPAFANNREMPIENSCDGADKSPALTWSSPPEDTKTFAIVLEDPDAPNGTFVHWVAYDINGETRVLPESADLSQVGGRLGSNDFQHVHYNGPCPPKHEGHHYVFHIFALNAPVNLPDGADKAALYTAMRGHVLGEGVLTGIFSR